MPDASSNFFVILLILPDAASEGPENGPEISTRLNQTKNWNNFDM